MDKREQKEEGEIKGEVGKSNEWTVEKEKEYENQWTKEKQGWERWEERLDNKIQKRIEQKLDNQDEETTSKIFQEKLESFNNRMVEKIKEKRYVCVECGKAFLSRLYVEKHLKNKHKEQIQKLQKEANDEQFFLNYKNDPNRLKFSHIQQAYQTNSQKQQMSLNQRRTRENFASTNTLQNDRELHSYDEIETPMEIPDYINSFDF
eukprot:Anaeramoba_flamelloidesc5896_g1_i1.p1 GENE.c5896_g1_i1~~c5896_g1_i1.p1  ORF type:complete len:205 (+),score=69.11 c5896_g1_i1:168-782(+)